MPRGAGRQVPAASSRPWAAGGSSPAATAARTAQASSAPMSPVITGPGYGRAPHVTGSVEGTAGRADQLADHPDHLDRVERLGQVGVHADLAALGPVLLLRPGGNHDHLDASSRPVVPELDRRHPAV